MRNDAAKSSLGRAYTGPYKVVNQQLKFFTLDFGHKYECVVSVDRLKAAHLLFDSNQVDKSQKSQLDICEPEIHSQSKVLLHSNQDFQLNRLFGDNLNCDNEQGSKRLLLREPSRE